MEIIDFVILLLVILSIFFDLTKKTIPNFVTIPVVIVGFILNLINFGYKGVQLSLIGLFVGLGIFIIPFIFGGMGGGDVKLMAAIGALKGWRFVLSTAVFSGLAGGIIVVIILIRQKKLLVTLKRVMAIILKPIMFVLTLTFENKKLKQFNSWLIDSQINWEKQYIPYGVAIGIGAMITLFIMR